MLKKINYPQTGACLEYTPVPGAKGLVVICPGGGYELISPREGEPVARAFARAGWLGFVLTYSVRKGEGGVPLGTTPLKEVAWAVRTARAEAEKLGVGGKKLAVCGFSAGGHLAASLGVHWDDGGVFPDSGVWESQRPDALVLSYPVITAGEYCHAGSMERLVGEGGDAGFYSLERYVNRGTPPAFIWHTAADGSVPVQNSLMFAEGFVRCGVGVELHVYPVGVHGLSLATEEVNQVEEGRVADGHVAGWFGLCVEWLDEFVAGGEKGGKGGKKVVVKAV